MSMTIPKPAISFAVALASWLGFAGSSHCGPQPNFVLILADDLGYGDPSCYGGKISTPAIDRLARQGVRFTDFHSSGNVCSPTRAGLVTGRYQQRAGIPDVINADPKLPVHHTGLSTEEITFAELLSNAGYATAIIGKWHLGYSKQFNPLHHGFDRFHGFVSGNIDYHSHYDRMEVFDWWNGLELSDEAGYSTHLITDHAVDFIKQSATATQPFCLFVAHEAVHAPWQGPNDPIQRGPNKVPRTEQLSDSDEKRDRAFREMLVELDRSVARILQTLDEQGIARNTMVCFCSDNGPAGGSAGGLRGRKGSNWEGGHRVPAVIRWPGMTTPNSTNSELCITLDLMPTMLAAANVRLPVGHLFDGTNLVPVLDEGRSLKGRKLFWNGKAMRHGDWKLITPKHETQPRLYDLSTDLSESNDLSKTEPRRVERMLAEIAAWSAAVHP